MGAGARAPGAGGACGTSAANFVCRWPANQKRGRSSREIAALRQVRCDSVRRQISHLYRKADVCNQRSLLAWALEQGLLRPADLSGP